MPINELITEIANKANINLDSIFEDIKTKFVRYITYFKHVFYYFFIKVFKDIF
jgi:hypothetical protein